MIKSVFSDGVYYVAMEYQHLSFPQYFSKKLNLKSCVSEKQHPYLKKTPLFKLLNKKISCDLNVQLIRKNRAWMLEYNEILAQLRDDEFKQLYANAQSGSFLLTPSSARLAAGDVFDFKLSTKKSGYVTLFNVYADGMVSLLQENIPVSSRAVRTFPVARDEVIFEAALLEKGKENMDMFVGIFSAKKGNFSLFREASGSVYKSESQYQFESLLNLMGDYDFSSVLVRVLPVQNK